MHVPRRVIRPQSTLTEWVAGAKIPTRHGEFETHVFRSALAAEANPDELPQEHRGRSDEFTTCRIFRWAGVAQPDGAANRKSFRESVSLAHRVPEPDRWGHLRC